MRFVFGVGTPVNESMNRGNLLVVIVSTDDAHWLGSCLEALAASSCPSLDVLLVANGCMDDTIQTAKSALASIQIVDIETRCGFAEATNVGIALALSEGYKYIFLLNPDTRVHHNAIDHLRRFLDTNASYGIVGSQQISYDTADWITPNEWTIDTLAEAQRLGNSLKRVGAWNVVDHYYVQGAALLVRADLLREIGAFDTVYVIFYEETDLCRRCTLAGRRVGILLDSRVKHYGGGFWRSSVGRHRWRDELMLRNQFIFELSGCKTWPGMLVKSVRVFCCQVRNLFNHNQRLCLSLWNYPLVIARVIRLAPEIVRMRRRNVVIRRRFSAWRV
jgi:GT2 family glycosyltransferase